MPTQWQDESFVVACDSAGVIQFVVRDDFNHYFPLEPGHSLLEIFNPGSTEKAGQFLADLKRYGSAQSWELDVAKDEEVYTFRFQGIQVGTLIYIAGSYVLQRSSDPATNRPLVLNADFYNELSRLNNEMMNAQRLLAKTQLELKTERDLLSVTLASVQDAIIATTPSGQIRLMNAMAESILCKPYDEARGKPLREIFVLLEEEARNKLFTAMEKGSVASPTIEATITNWEGKHIPIEASGAAIVDVTETNTGFVLSFRDITHRKAVEAAQARLLAEAHQARVEAERANAQRLRFMAMVTHDLRNPLTSIRGFSSTLLETDIAWNETQQREFIRIIDSEAIRLTELIDQLLQVSEIEANVLKVEPTRSSIDEIVTNVMPVLRSISTDHRLTINVPLSIPPVLADKGRVAQVLTNLVSNAVKYSPPLTEVRVEVSEVPGFVKVTVSDKGPGIPLEERDRVFEAFHRMERDRSQQKGTGLGLAICKGLVEAHNGRIWIEGGPTGGTTICFTLPMYNT
jgi:PAS domain S-box-containing protein